MRRLVVVALGTLGFGMADVLPEPYGGRVLDLSVSDTTKLTAMLALGSLTGFALASRVLARGFDPLIGRQLMAQAASGPRHLPCCTLVAAAALRRRHYACRIWCRATAMAH
ncbi:MAG: PucC family protein [Nitratireductor sp.]